MMTANEVRELIIKNNKDYSIILNTIEKEIIEAIGRGNDDIIIRPAIPEQLSDFLKYNGYDVKKVVDCLNNYTRISW